MTHTCCYIPAHVHFAFEGDAVVFMNLRTDQYSLLLGKDARAFRSMICDSGAGGVRTIGVPEHDPANPDTPEYALLRELQANYLVVYGQEGALAPTSVRLPRPEETLLSPDDFERPECRLIDILQFMKSCVLTAGRLAFFSVEHTLMNIPHRRETIGAGRRISLSEARRLVGIYNYLRPFFPKACVCLFDSLALLDFLAHHGCLPYLVFAVTLEPWEAHCWLQYGAVSFNEDAERARTFLPILTV